MTLWPSAHPFDPLFVLAAVRLRAVVIRWILPPLASDRLFDVLARHFPIILSAAALLRTCSNAIEMGDTRIQ